MKRHELAKASTPELTARLQTGLSSADAELIKEELVQRYQDLVGALACKFTGSGQPFEDLLQVGNYGLLKAIERYDSTRGAKFSTFATTTILGELRRWLRDRAWDIRVPRRLQELNWRVRKLTSQLEQQSQRSPTLEELARRLEVSQEELLEALELGKYYKVGPFEREDASAEYDLADILGAEDPLLQALEDREFIARTLQHLAEKERKVIVLKFYQGLTQAEIARRLGVSQMHISRLQRRALARLRQFLQEEN